MNTLIDNDVLHKSLLYGLTEELILAINANQASAILGAAPFLIRKKMEKLVPELRQPALERLSATLATVQILEPTGEEIAHAAELELAAQLAGVDLDPGESQLCAAMLRRSLDRLITGDKRAIAALEVLLGSRSELNAMAGKVLCLEQCFILSLSRGADHDTFRVKICGSFSPDKALAICFRCHSIEQALEDTLACLRSYVEDLRHKAPTFLAP
jgi:hypothetical protein